MAPFAHIFDHLGDRTDHALCGHAYRNPVELRRGQRPNRLCRACQEFMPQVEAVHWRQVAAKLKAANGRLSRQQRVLTSNYDELWNEYESLWQAYEDVIQEAENQRLELEKLRKPGPTSLLAAMTAVRIPAGNHSFIRSYTHALGISEYHAVSQPDNPYVRAVRRSGEPDLHIHYGYTSGFRSENEIDRVVGHGPPRGQSSRHGTWYVEHPINKAHSRTKKSRDVRRTGTFCSCGLQLSLTGVCASCD